MRITAIEKRREQLTDDLHRELNRIYNMIRASNTDFILLNAKVLDSVMIKALQDDGYDVLANKFTNDGNETITEYKVKW